MDIDRERVIIQELNEAQVRIFHLEKTIKWWSECTSNWREKWGSVRTQRNKLHDDLVIVKDQYKSLTLEYAKIKNEKDMLQIELDELSGKKVVQFESSDEKEKMKNEKDNIDYEKNETKTTEANSSISSPTTSTGSNSTCDSLVSKLTLDLSTLKEEELVESAPILQEDIESLQNFVLGIEEPTELKSFKTLEKVKDYIKSCQVFLQLKNREIIDLKSENKELNEKYEKLKEYCYNDENKKSGMNSPPKYKRNISTEVKMNELHNEIQRLQQENCNEWTRREQCETDMSELRREFNCSNQTIEELKCELVKKGEEVRKSQTISMKLLNEELDEKSKAFVETKSHLNKTKKQLQEKSDALVHEKKRTEHYEGEMKKLRVRIDQLKQQLLTSEEKVDLQGNHVRRLQRSLEEQSQVNEAFQSQIRHLNARLQRQKTNHSNHIEEENITTDEEQT